MLAGGDYDWSLEHVAANRTQKARINFVRHDINAMYGRPLGGVARAYGRSFPINHAHCLAVRMLYSSEGHRDLSSRNGYVSFIAE